MKGRKYEFRKNLKTQRQLDNFRFSTVFFSMPPTILYCTQFAIGKCIFKCCANCNLDDWRCVLLFYLLKDYIILTYILSCLATDAAPKMGAQAEARNQSSSWRFQTRWSQPADSCRGHIWWVRRYLLAAYFWTYLVDGFKSWIFV